MSALDAPDVIPTRPMCSLPSRYYDRSTCLRGVNLAERIEQDLADITLTNVVQGVDLYITFSCLDGSDLTKCHGASGDFKGKRYECSEYSFSA